MKANLFNITLVKPEIPQNTGNIGRLCVSTSCKLHLIKPLGFSLDDSYVKRAGLDYWKHLDLSVYDDWNFFLKKNSESTFYFFSTKTERSFWDCPFTPGAFLIFGNESSGLPPDFYERYSNNLYTIPMPGEFHRSLNIANAVSIALYEGLRKNMGEKDL